MPKTIKAKNSMPRNSPRPATKSYSSQCGLPERMMCHPFQNCLFDARIGGHLTSRFDADQKFLTDQERNPELGPTWTRRRRDYEEFMGAKKHLVASVLFHAGRLSNSLAIGAHRG